MPEKNYTSFRKKRNFFGVEILTAGYVAITSVIVIVLWNRLDNPGSFLLARMLIISGMFLAYSATSMLNFAPATAFVRVLFSVGLITYWYPETYEFNKIFGNLDHVFASAEQSIFGFQPALAFSKHFSSEWISEAFYMGYFFYFPMMMFVILYCFFYQREKFDKLTFIFLGSFFLYYFLFIFIPVTGPQFYFPVIGTENAENGFFLNVGNYFYYNSELLPVSGYGDGLFNRCVRVLQAMGERPTAAFPSSHVGISTILMMWLYRNNKRIMFIVFPLYALLCGATVYIKAHYLIDVFAGFMSAFAFYGLFALSFDKLYGRRGSVETGTPNPTKQTTI